MALMAPTGYSSPPGLLSAPKRSENWLDFAARSGTLWFAPTPPEGFSLSAAASRRVTCLWIGRRGGAGWSEGSERVAPVREIQTAPGGDGERGSRLFPHVDRARGVDAEGPRAHLCAVLARTWLRSNFASTSKHQESRTGAMARARPDRRATRSGRAHARDRSSGT